MLALCDLYSPVIEPLPLVQVLTILNKKIEQDTRAELWQHYMANVIVLFAEKGAKTYAEVLADFDNALSTDSEAEIKEAYDNASAVLQALEDTRRG